MLVEPKYRFILTFPGQDNECNVFEYYEGKCGELIFQGTYSKALKYLSLNLENDELFYSCIKNKWLSKYDVFQTENCGDDLITASA